MARMIECMGAWTPGICGGMERTTNQVSGSDRGGCFNLTPSKRTSRDGACTQQRDPPKCQEIECASPRPRARGAPSPPRACLRAVREQARATTHTGQPDNIETETLWPKPWTPATAPPPDDTYSTPQALQRPREVATQPERHASADTRTTQSLAKRSYHSSTAPGAEIDMGVSVLGFSCRMSPTQPPCFVGYFAG